MTVSLNSPNGRYGQLYLSNYASLHLRDELSRLPGISEVLVFGQRDCSIRVWLQPDLLAERHLTVLDVQTALREQNVQLVAGQLGQSPSASDQPWQFPLASVGRLQTPEEFGDIILRVSNWTAPLSMASAHLSREKNTIYPHRACLGGIMPNSYPSGQGNPSADLVAIRQHVTDAISVVKRTCVALLSPSGAVQLRTCLHVAPCFVWAARRSMFANLRFTCRLLMTTNQFSK